MKKYRFIMLTILLAIISMVTLASFTGLFSPIEKNGFNRFFLGELKSKTNLKRPSSIKGLIGKNVGRIWFSTSIANELYSADLKLGDVRLEKVNTPLNQKWQNAFLHFFENGRFYSWAPQVPALYGTNPGHDQGISAFRFPHTFTRGLMIGPASFIMRAFLPKGKSYEQAFIRYNARMDSLLVNRSITEDLGDLGMLTDGMLHYDTASHLAIYVQYFSNNITWLDTNLNVVRRGHTIDTFSHIGASMEVLQGSANRKKATFNAPPKFINIDSKVYKGLLFNYSGKRADNEEKEGYVGGSKIDVYLSIDGKYLGSWKVPSFGKDFMESFDIIDGQLLAIYKNQIVLFNIEQRLLDRLR